MPLTVLALQTPSASSSLLLFGAFFLPSLPSLSGDSARSVSHSHSFTEQFRSPLKLAAVQLLPGINPRYNRDCRGGRMKNEGGGQYINITFPPPPLDNRSSIAESPKSGEIQVRHRLRNSRGGTSKTAHFVADVRTALIPTNSTPPVTALVVAPSPDLRIHIVLHPQEEGALRVVFVGNRGHG